MKDKEMFKSAFGFLDKEPTKEPVKIAETAPVETKPVRTVGNMYSAVQAQSIFNPGQVAPPDPANGQSAGPIGNNSNNQTIKGTPANQAQNGTVGALAPNEGWGKTNG